MNREIKFRGKTGTVQGDIWAYGYLYKVKSLLDDNYQYYIRNEHLQNCLVDEETIGQFTGLYDKNGAEIYEGDFVKFTSGLGGKETCVIYYDERQNSLNIKNYPRGYIYDGLYNLKNKKEIEVIGNIYDKEEQIWN